MRRGSGSHGQRSSDRGPSGCACERGEYVVARGGDPTPYIEAMLHFANDCGMIPEQVWDRADPTPLHFIFGSGTGSATPLVWSMAQLMRLVIDAQERRIVEQPAIVAERFLGHAPATTFTAVTPSSRR